MARARFLVLVLLAGCKAPDYASPEGAFVAMAPCVDNADARCLYHRIDRGSQWSVQTIARTLGEIGAIARRSYPAALRSQAFGTWVDASSEREPVGVFAVYCRNTRCVEPLARGFGAVAKTVAMGPDRVAVETIRGGRFVMNRAEGRWGLALYGEALEAEKIRILDRIAEVRRNAAAFDEQRIASGIRADEKEKRDGR